ncbi:MAG: 3'-5' exonuclease [Ilumatobacteraceae bacterium]|nr:3'-5' exonuclease [Ilumatobacter sp.]MCB0984778.1 3'-5' exonuclease [Ilumatobacter sp.]
MTTPISTERFAVVDVETSGLSVRRHHVLQVGVVVVDGDGTVLDRWSSLLAPRRRWWFRVGPTRLHGIHRRDLRKAAPAAEVLAELARRMEGARFVAHNAGFDAAFLTKAAQAHGVELPIAQPLCTLRMSRALDPDRQFSHRLGDLCGRYGITLVRPHDALADADATAAVLPHLLAAHGVISVEQLPALAALGNRQPS